MRKFTRDKIPQAMQALLDRSKTKKSNEAKTIVDLKDPSGRQYEVTVELCNGLGNRIFQILAAIGYGEKYNKRPVICKAFSNDGPKSHEKNLHNVLIKIFPNIKVIDSMQSFNIVSERQYFNYTDLPYHNTDVVLKGYFQAEGYLPSPGLIPDIRSNFYNNIYFIHIRAGDYLLFQNEWGIDVPDYLKKCFDKINNNIIKYIVFSDDVEYARGIMSEFNVNYVFSDKTDPYETLVEMANCAGGICANSSFSWLGALFQKGQNKWINPQIFMPSIWNKVRDCRGVYPKWACIINVNPSAPSKYSALSLSRRAMAIALAKIPSTGISMAEALVIAGQMPDKTTHAQDMSKNSRDLISNHPNNGIEPPADTSFLVEELVRRARESQESLFGNNILVDKSRKTNEDINYNFESRIEDVKLAQVTSPEIILPTITLEHINLQGIKIAERLVTIEITGYELGEKIFMILAGLGYAEKYNKEFVFCKTLFNEGMNYNEKRCDEILIKLFPNISWIDSIGPYFTLKEEVVLDYKALPYKPGNVLLSGYFQNEGYFPSKSIPKIQTSSYTEYFVHIDTRNSLEDTGGFGYNKTIYYSNCFNLLGPDISYIIFSDDNSYAENYMKQFNVKYILSQKTCLLEILIEMSNCAGGICINSPFSWMAGFFQRDNIGRVFFPSVWNSNFRESSKFLGEWATVISAESSSNPVIRIGGMKYNVSKCKLYEWQYTLKEPSSLIIQGSSLSVDNLWMPFPIGISWQYVKYFNNSRAWQIGSHNNLVLCNINLSSDSKRRATGINRKQIIDTLRNNNIQNIDLSGENYCSRLSSYKFVISPEGNEIDSHMHYEALLAGCIPIIEYNYKLIEKYKGCPVLYTKDYSEITYDYLENKYKELTIVEYDFSRLFTTYYSKEEQEEIKKYGTIHNIELVDTENENTITRSHIINDSLITIKLEGGLANRIFKVLAGLGISEKTSSEFVICKSFIRDGDMPHEKNLLNHLIQIFPNIKIIDKFNDEYQYIETKEHFMYNEIVKTDKNLVLHGAFQNEQYFPSKNLIPRLRNAYYANTYFIHIRAGDYLNDTGFKLNLINYYSRCFSLLNKNTKYIVFSNDNKYADTYIKQFNIDYSISDKEDPLDVLIEMANCAGGICANSSLSWLSGYFQKEPRGKIFMPSPWMNGIDYKGVYPSWATIIDINSGEIVKNTNNYMFDILIPVGPNDTDIIRRQITYTKRNIIGYRNIYLIASNSSLNVDGCISISEDIFPFSIKTIENIHEESSRCGWYLQQLIKLYAGNIIPGILDKYLVIDSDTYFLKPTRFIEMNTPLYAYGSEYHTPYFEHMKRLDPSFIKVDKQHSGICHHMLFETIYINEIIQLVEQRHNDTFYNIFIKQVDNINFSRSGASEYEIYYNYMLKYHPDKIKLRPLKWNNLRKLSNSGINDYESVHWHSRDSVVGLQICAVMWYDANIRSYADITLKINREYCKKYNIDLIVSGEKTYTNRHAAWEKLPLVLKYIKEYDYVIWIDADAFFYKDAKNIRTIIEENINQPFIFSNDKGNYNINSGVFIVKNTEYSINFLNKWAYDNRLYIKNSFPGWWEQGVLIDMFKQNILDIQSNNIYYPYGILQHFSIDPVESFMNKPYVLHMAGQSTETRVSISTDYFYRHIL
jgi:hypothetical protein